MSLEIRDSAGVRLASKYNYIDKGAVTFTHKIAANTSGGEYTIRVWGNTKMAPVTKVIRIRDLPRDFLLV